MGIGSALSIYLLVWVVTLFAVLPFGVRTPDEVGAEKVKGQADSAPVRPQMLKKLAWTTIVSAIIFGLFVANYEMGWIGIEDFPHF